MGIEEIIIIVLLAVILVAAILYIYKARKRGEKCIGCPYSKQCSGNCNGSCSNKNTK